MPTIDSHGPAANFCKLAGTLVPSPFGPRAGVGCGWRLLMAKGNGSAAGASVSDKVARLMSREGLSRERARDHLIMAELKRGDTAALAAMLIDGHVPAPHVRLVLALMLLENEEAEAALATHRIDPELWWVPHRLIVKPRPARPRRPHEALLGSKHGASANSGRLMPDVGYQAAIARVDEAVRAADSSPDSRLAKPPSPKRPGSKPKTKKK